MTTQRNEELAFAVLADQVRRQILDTLATHGECNAGFISDQI
ncbi:MAG: transcriptional regulator, partial [Rhodococcus sp. (in: high G+C Gram-positive bacteria)]